MKKSALTKEEIEAWVKQAIQAHHEQFMAIIREAELKGSVTTLNGDIIETYRRNTMTGRFVESLTRNNSKIKADRAEAISEDAELVFKRVVEDIEVEIKKCKRDRENMLDLSPNNALTLMVASDFAADKFVAKDLELGIKIRNLEIKLEIAKKRYQELFFLDTEDTTEEK